MRVRLSPIVYISASLTCLTISVLLIAAFIGLVPERESAILQGRKELCETIAIHCSVAAQRKDLSTITEAMRAVVQRNPAIVSAAVRDAKGKMVIEAGDHESQWDDGAGKYSTPTHVHVPIAMGDKLWGTVELRFQPPSPTGIRAWLANPLLRLGTFVALTSFALYFVYLRRLLASQDTSQLQGIPQRIRDTLNTLAEGVLILDKDERIALANEAFANIIEQSPATLQGRKVSELPWSTPQAENNSVAYPWDRAIRQATAQMGDVLALRTEENRLCRLSVNSTPIMGDDGSRRGVLATFDDLTPVERKNSQLRKMMQRLKQSRAEIRRQNQVLKTLATRDPLTSCLNRRSFLAEFERLWGSAQRYDHALSCVMVDIDHFKSINDRHGHRVGDQVLQHVAQLLRTEVRQGDLVCRYGGEEFCILLPHTDLIKASQAAERFRQEIASRPCADVTVTASLGVSALGLGAPNPRELLDQADQALYGAKRGGRNRVVRWNELPDNAESEQRPVELPDPARTTDPESRITFHAVTALLSALAYRSLEAAEHSRRVADLCVAVARRLLPLSQCYHLEVAALLHDIGKLGIPDAILCKPGPLTDEEWKVIRSHEHVGGEILMAAFTCPELRDTVRTHHCWYGGTPYNAELPRGKDIPLGARILAIADAFDAIVSDRVYRKGRSRQEAFAELRRCAGTQFDPELVEQFIDIVSAHEGNRSTPALFVSKQTALQIGLQVEKLATAVDAHDLQTLRIMVSRIGANASEHGIDQIAEVAARLEQSAGSGSDWLELTQLTLNLLDLCRSTYVSYLPQPDNADHPEPDVQLNPTATESHEDKPACLVS